MTTDLVNHPAHYEEQVIKLEPIDFCELFPFCEGNALKYCFRAGHKEGSSELQDLKKASWYLTRAASSPNAAEVPTGDYIDAMKLLLCRADGVLGIAAREYYEDPFANNLWRTLGKNIDERIAELEGTK